MNEQVVIDLIAIISGVTFIFIAYYGIKEYMSFLKRLSSENNDEVMKKGNNYGVDNK